VSPEVLAREPYRVVELADGSALSCYAVVIASGMEVRRLEGRVELPRGPRHRRGGVVQLMSETGGELAERDHLLVLQLVRVEHPRPVDHRLNHPSRSLHSQRRLLMVARKSQ
jgi:hypothetical protein